MPELPEVEIARRCAARWLEGRRLVRVWASPGKPLRGVTPAALSRTLEGRTVRRIERIGKHLLWALDRGVAVHVHLGMTGKIVCRKPGEAPPDHERVGLAVAGRTVHFTDPRRFGRFELVPAGELRRAPEVAALGPDALAPLSGPALAARAGKGRRAVKVALMDQRVLAGLGNIQAAEGLFRARLSPFERVADLAPADWRRLARAIHASLRGTLKASVPDRQGNLRYVEENGAPNPFAVYGHAGDPCPRCGTTIARAVLAQRSTFWCPRCQAGRKPAADPPGHALPVAPRSPVLRKSGRQRM